MTKEEILAMQPGEGLDYLIATEILELKEGVDFGTFPEHDWKKDEDDDIDIFAYESDHCNGPACVRCGHGYCHHCYPNGDGEPCVIEISSYSTTNHVPTLEKIFGKLHHCMKNHSIHYDGHTWSVYDEDDDLILCAMTLSELICKYALIRKLDEGYTIIIDNMEQYLHSNKED